MLARLEHSSLRYLTDCQGRRTAVVVDIETWNEIIEVLEDIEDAEEMRVARDEEDVLVPWKRLKKNLVSQGS